jgi:hypothetical protein
MMYHFGNIWLFSSILQGWNAGGERRPRLEGSDNDPFQGIDGGLQTVRREAPSQREVKTRIGAFGFSR